MPYARIFECIDETIVNARGYLEQRLNNASAIARVNRYGFCRPGDGKLYLLAYLQISPEDYESKSVADGNSPMVIALRRGAATATPIPRREMMQAITGQCSK